MSATQSAGKGDDPLGPPTTARHRIGLIVPSSNVTMETELPELFAQQTAATGERCAAELADAECDVLAYARLVAMIAPYAPALTAQVIGYLAGSGIEVVDAVSLNVTDNRAVGRLDPRGPLGLVERLDLRRAEALVVSACVQMPSLASVAAAQDLTGLPTLSAATATAAALSKVLAREPVRI